MKVSAVGDTVVGNNIERAEKEDSGPLGKMFLAPEAHNKSSEKNHNISKRCEVKKS
jgi:hypothetical protein